MLTSQSSDHRSQRVVRRARGSRRARLLSVARSAAAAA